MTATEIHKAVLKDYARAVVHLREQVQEKRFGLILGAGVVTDFNVPMWPELVEKVAADPEVEGTDLLKGEASKKSLPYQAEMLFQHYKGKARTKIDPSATELFIQSAVNAGWSKICGKYIYAGAPKKLEGALKKHVYFSSLLPLVRGSHLTITFNFDDFLEHGVVQLVCKRDPMNTWRQFMRLGKKRGPCQAAR